MIPQDFRTNQVSVNLLQNQDKNGEDQSIARIDHQENENTWNRTNERTEERQNIRNADHNTDQDRIFHIGHEHENIAQNPNDQRIDDFARDESRKNCICSSKPEYQRFSSALLKQGVTRALAPPTDTLFLNVEALVEPLLSITSKVKR